MKELIPKVSVVIPVFNEENSVLPLYELLLPISKKIGGEIIFVNDGSTDKTEEKLTSLRQIKIITLRRNFGQTAALLAGIDNAKGKIIVTLDGDGQNDPADIPRLIKKLNSGFDVVSGWRKNRHDPLTKRFISKGADFLRKLILRDDIHDAGCTLKAYRSECFDELDLYGELHRFIPSILSWKGFLITEIPVNHLPRKHGQSKYSLGRIIKGFIDLINVWFWYKFSSRPLHLFGGVGLLLILAGALLTTGLTIAKFFYSVSLAEKIWPLVAFFLILAGIQLFVSGILADIAIKNYFSSPKRSTYAIKKINQS